MSVLFVTHPSYLEHIAGHHHPERPARLDAVVAGAHRAGLGEAMVPLAPRPATRDELERVHPVGHLDALSRFCATGGGHIDPDTGAVPESWDAAVLAAGAGLAAVEALDAGQGQAAFCAVRPPGHHATPDTAMGFCLVNNVAVVAAHLAARGERVVIVDYDAHHGNGTQDCFWSDGRVLYVSFHQHPLYPGSGRLRDIGIGAGEGTTMNLPLPPGATGDVYLAALDRVVLPTVAAFAPTWLIISAGFDAHRDDPLTDLGLTSGDFARITARLCELVPAGRRLAMLEGGYDLDALASSTGATLAVLAGHDVAPAEAATSGGPGMTVVDAAVSIWSLT
jgi:acetoin utilization deacetylase AcuC-like enzyme